MTDLSFATVEDFVALSKDLTYPQIRTYAKKIGVTGLREKRNILEDKILAILSERKGSSPKQPSPPKQRSLPKRSPSKQPSPPKRSPRSVQRSVLAPARPVKSPPSFPISRKKYSEVLDYAFHSGTTYQLQKYLEQIKPSLEGLNIAIGQMKGESPSNFLPVVVDVLFEFYGSISPPIRDKLARYIFAISLENDSVIAFNVAIRIAPPNLTMSTKVWRSILSECVSTGALNCFQSAVRLGILDMDQYRGKTAKAVGVSVVIDAIRAGSKEDSTRRLFYLILEEMVLLNDIHYLTMEDLARLINTP